MAVGTVTTVAGAGATVPDDTSFPVLESNDGGMPLVAVGYVDGSNESQPLVTVDGVKVNGSATLTGLGAGTASRGTVADTASSTTIIPANADRRGWRIRNTSSAVLYVAFGGTASATNNVDALAQNAGTGDAGVGVYSGDIVGVWASDPGDGVAIWTEWEE